MRRTHIILFRGLFVAALLAVAYLAVMPPDYPVASYFNDKVNHIIAFFLLAMLADFSFPRSRFGWRKIWPLVLFGLFIEIIQHFLQFRVFSMLDVLAGLFGLFLYACSPPLLRHLPFIQMRWQ